MSSNVATQTERSELTTSPAESSARPGSGTWWLAAVGLLAVIAVFFGETILRLATRWSNEPDYSHGFLVPPFAAYLLWYRRDMAKIGEGGRFIGLLLLVASAVFRLGAAYYAYPLADAAGLLLCLPGAVLLLGGWQLLRWAWPAIVFLVFMIPLPGVLSERLAGPLQHVATLCGTYALQTLGVPAANVGNIIHLSQEPPIMVVEACSGLRMLICFIAITVGAAFVVEWGLLERLVIVLSGIPIAVAANVTRIASTGLIQEHFGPEIASKVFHDFAGWLMMPLACLFVALELWLLNKTFPQSESGAPVAMLTDASRKTSLPSGRAVVVPAERKQSRR